MFHGFLKFNKIYFLLIIIFVQACSYTFPPESEEVKNIKTFIKDLCPLNQRVDTSKDIILATLYYKTNEVDFSKEDKVILNKVIDLFNSCNKKILILSHTSNKEFNINPVLAGKLSYLRAYNVYNYLKDYILNNNLYFSFCSNLRNKFIEEYPNAVLGNQRVEIIMLGNNVSSSVLNCFIKANNGFD